jgi:hypothetical protein
MSNGIDNLLSDMKTIFGEFFGVDLEEARRPMPRVEPSRAVSIGKKARHPLPHERMKATPDIQKIAGKAVSKEKAAELERVAKRVARERPDVDLDKILKDLEKDSQAAAAKHMFDPLARRQQLGRHPHANFRTVAGMAKGNQDNYPFKHHHNLGPGPGTPPESGVTKPRGPRNHKERGCWHCVCPNGTYSGCVCRGTGKTSECPKGEIKHVPIKKQYHRAYNRVYHAWRAKHGGKNPDHFWHPDRQVKRGRSEKTHGDLTPKFPSYATAKDKEAKKATVLHQLRNK